MIKSTLLRSLYVCRMELKKRMPRALKMPGIFFFVNAKHDLEMLPPTQYALELKSLVANMHFTGAIFYLDSSVINKTIFVGSHDDFLTYARHNHRETI